MPVGWGKTEPCQEGFVETKYGKREKRARYQKHPTFFLKKNSPQFTLKVQTLLIPLYKEKRVYFMFEPQILYNVSICCLKQ